MILVGGENLIDFIQTGTEDGIRTYKAMPGGSPFNCAMAIGRQGVPVGYLTPISNDSLGRTLANRLTESNVDLLSKRRSEPTSLAVVALENGVPSYQFYREQTAERMVTLDSLIAATPEDAKGVYVGSLALTDGADAEVWADYFCAAKSIDLFTTLDPNIRPAFIHDREKFLARLDRVLMHTDLLKLSDEDLDWLVPNNNLVATAKAFAKRTTAKVIVVTLGDKGAFALVDGKTVTIPPAPVKNLRDTVGAGDTFMATLIATLAQDDALSTAALADMKSGEVEALITRAALAAALNCERDGCNPPSSEEIDLAHN